MSYKILVDGQEVPTQIVADNEEQAISWVARHLGINKSLVVVTPA